ncbi:hypothetical protein AAW50_03555 [Mycoplasmopsis canis]|uniref:hypothetical protein n=1 Tax=Mycoplasmopsis canis TaxID=29555 RepID=UPI000624CCAB|nr:hypothetical protein [Mycoplasmopsis canis]AKF41465.1 hypothetical protein AAW50_03555 [Mycoplasmopsis canis]
MKKSKLLNTHLIKNQQDFYKAYLDSYSRITRANVVSALDYFIKDNDIDLNLINKKIRETLENNSVSKRTLHVYITILKTYVKASSKFFNLEIDEDNIDYVESQGPAMKVAYSEKQIEIIKKELKNNNDELLEFWVNFIAYNGCRPVEAEKALKNADWFWIAEHGTFIAKFQAAKNNHERIMMVPPEFKTFFEKNKLEIKTGIKNLKLVLAKRWERFFKSRIETNEFWDRDVNSSKDIYTFRHTWFTKGHKKGYTSSQMMIASGHKNAATIDENYINRNLDFAVDIMVGVNEREILETKNKQIIIEQNKQLQTAIENATKLEKNKNDLIDMLKNQNENLEREIKIIKNELDKNNNNFKDFCEFVEKTTNIDLTNLYSIFTQKGVSNVK